MKKIILTAAIALLGLGTTFAQTANTNNHHKKGTQTVEQRAQKATDQLDKRVILTADQKTKVYQIELNKFNKAKDMMAKNTDKKANKSEREELNKTSKKEVEALLTIEQKKNFKDWKAEQHKGEMKKHQKNQSAPLVSKPASQN